jgi:DUF971 family protein
VTPTEISRANAHDIKVAWQDGHESIFPAGALRAHCPCAVCIDAPAKALGAAHHVHPVSIELVGRYAISIQWSDGHDSGIYAFERLRRLCPCSACVESAATS